MRTLSIPREKIPSNLFDVELMEPLFRHRRTCFERHPGETANYTVQELLLASCLKSVNGEPVPETRDVLDNLKGLPHKDGQFLMAVFMNSFLLDADDTKRSKDLCLAFSKSNRTEVVIMKEDMPTKRFGIVFRMPSYNDRRKIQRLYPKSEADCGFSFEELFFASCLMGIGDSPVPENLKHSAVSTISVLDEWSLLDIQFALSVFLSLTTLDPKENDEAADLGKFLRTSSIESESSSASPTTPSSKSSPATSKK